MSPPDPPAPPEEPGRPPDDEPLGIDRWIAPFYRDPTLWPVSIVGLVALSVFGAALVLLALAIRNVFAIVALVLLVGISVDRIQLDLRRRRFGLVTRTIVAVWVLIACTAAAAVHYGLF